jgi:hemerythrin superfamily protein
MTDALTLLKQDHRQVEQLFERFEHLAGEGLSVGKGELVSAISRELSVHAAIEEQVFYPAVRRALPQGEEVAEHLRQEHEGVKEILAELEGMEPGSAGYDTRVGMLISDVRGHVREEEGDVFPRLAEQLEPSTLDAMGEELEKAKRTAPTQPHPRAPSEPLANVLTGPPTAALDRIRDAPRHKKVALLAVAGGVLGLIAWRTARRRSV